MGTPVTADFTPWPWTVSRAQSPPERLFINGARGQSVAMIFEKNGVDGPGWNNAHLMAAAPELREMLRKLLTVDTAQEFDQCALDGLALLDRLGGCDA